MRLHHLVQLFFLCVGISAQQKMGNMENLEKVVQKNIPLARKYMAKLVPGNCDYCTLGGTNPFQNTFCKNYQGVASKCGRVLASGVEESMKQTILDLHNDYRRKIAKGEESMLSYTASDMMEVTWDEELARGAQMWANQCEFQHDENDVCRFHVGQNLYKSGHFKNPSDMMSPAWREAMESWYSEIKDFKENPTEPSNNYLGTGHFSQLIWAKTQYVGCGYIAHEGYDGSSMYDTKYYVCNYGPAGNWLQHKVFSSGSPCSRCPGGSSCNRGLCRDQSSPAQSSGGTTTTTTDSYWSTTTTEKIFNKPAKKPKCDLKILKKYINSCEV